MQEVNLFLDTCLCQCLLFDPALYAVSDFRLVLDSLQALTKLTSICNIFSNYLLKFNESVISDIQSESELYLQQLAADQNARQKIYNKELLRRFLNQKVNG